MARFGHDRVLKTLACAVSAVWLVACAGPRQAATPPAAQPAAPAVPTGPTLVRTLPPEGLGAVERYAWQSVLQLGEDYAAGDVGGFLAKVSRGFYRGYPALESSLRALVARSTARTAIVAVRGVSTDGDRVSVRAEWSRSVTRPDGAVEPRSGETQFLFLKSETSLRLLDYRGDAPFGIDGI
jgi:hypothetical protein